WTRTSAACACRPKARPMARTSVATLPCLDMETSRDAGLMARCRLGCADPPTRFDRAAGGGMRHASCPAISHGVRGGKPSAAALVYVADAPVDQGDHDHLAVAPVLPLLAARRAGGDAAHALAVAAAAAGGAVVRLVRRLAEQRAHRGCAVAHHQHAVAHAQAVGGGGPGGAGEQDTGQQTGQSVTMHGTLPV